MANKSRLAAVATAAVLGIGVWGLFVERHLRVLRNFDLPLLKKVGQSHSGNQVRVLHVSDLHLAPNQRRKAEWVRSLARLNPDLIVLTGDLLGHKDSFDLLEYTLAPFSGVPGVYVHGSNDYYGPKLKNPLKYLKKPTRLSTKVPDLDTARLNQLLNGLGFIDLNNTAADISVAGQKFRFFGLGDPHIRYDDVDEMSTNLKVLDDQSSADVRIGVVHAPYTESLDQLLNLDSSLIFSGHTHGGQVRLPVVGALTSNSDLPASMARGLSVWHDKNKASFLHVTAGLGTSIFAPIRVACRPEATLITLDYPA